MKMALLQKTCRKMYQYFCFCDLSLDDVASTYRACVLSIVEAESFDDPSTYNHDCRDSVDNHPEHQLRPGQWVFFDMVLCDSLW